jgi:hypothetical protein
LKFSYLVVTELLLSLEFNALILQIHDLSFFGALDILDLLKYYNGKWDLGLKIFGELLHSHFAFKCLLLITFIVALILAEEGIGLLLLLFWDRRHESFVHFGQIVLSIFSFLQLEVQDLNSLHEDGFFFFPFVFWVFKLPWIVYYTSNTSRVNLWCAYSKSFIWI